MNEKIEKYARIGAVLGCALGVGYGIQDAMRTYDLPFREVVLGSARYLPNITKPEFWLMTRDILAGLGAGVLVGGLVGKILNLKNKT